MFFVRRCTRFQIHVMIRIYGCHVVKCKVDVDVVGSGQVRRARGADVAKAWTLDLS